MKPARRLLGIAATVLCHSAKADFYPFVLRTPGLKEMAQNESVTQIAYLYSMNFIYKIVLFSILSFSLPIGVLFEIFIWNDRIINTETIFRGNRFGINGRFFLFIKIVKETNAKLSDSFHKKYEYTVRELHQNIRIRQALLIQKKQFGKFRNRLGRILICNIIYIDEPENQIILCS